MCILVMFGNEFCIKVYNMGGEELFCFGIGFLGKFLYFIKVILYNNEFFVFDVDKKNNCCMVSVFD